MTACQLVRSRIDHTRHGRPPHFLSRRGLSIWIDLDRLEAANSESVFFSVDRFNLLSLQQSDYGPNFRSRRPVIPLADYARDLARNICPDVDIGSVSLLTFPRILGVAFNPVSVYLLRDRDGADAMYIYEVRNTFGDMHSMWGARQTARRLSRRRRYSTSRLSFLSVGVPPSHACPRGQRSGSRVDAVFRCSAARLTATLRGTREKLTNLGVIRAMAATGQWPLRPLISIHVEAARLWWKRVPFHSARTAEFLVSGG